MAWSFLYRAVCGLFQLLALGLRSSERKELEILVLRYELAIARVGCRNPVGLHAARLYSWINPPSRFWRLAQLR